MQDPASYLPIAMLVLGFALSGYVHKRWHGRELRKLIALADHEAAQAHVEECVALIGTIDAWIAALESGFRNWKQECIDLDTLPARGLVAEALLANINQVKQLRLRMNERLQELRKRVPPLDKPPIPIRGTAAP